MSQVALINQGSVVSGRASPPRNWAAWPCGRLRNLLDWIAERCTNTSPSPLLRQRCLCLFKIAQGPAFFCAGPVLICRPSQAVRIFPASSAITPRLDLTETLLLGLVAMREIKERTSQLRKTQAPFAFRSLQDAVTEHVDDINRRLQARLQVRRMQTAFEVHELEKVGALLPCQPYGRKQPALHSVSKTAQ